MNTHILPTSDEIDAVVFDMIAAEAAQVPDDTSLDELWSSVALDSAGEFRGYGFGHTPAEAPHSLGSPLGGRSATCVPYRASCRRAGRSRSTRLARLPGSLSRTKC
jgi:hypothetical protein